MVSVEQARVEKGRGILIARSLNGDGVGIPEWMTKPDSAKFDVVNSPRLDRGVLFRLCLEIDALLAMLKRPLEKETRNAEAGESRDADGLVFNKSYQCTDSQNIASPSTQERADVCRRDDSAISSDESQRR